VRARNILPVGVLLTGLFPAVLTAAVRTGHELISGVSAKSTGDGIAWAVTTTSPPDVEVCTAVVRVGISWAPPPPAKERTVVGLVQRRNICQRRTGPGLAEHTARLTGVTRWPGGGQAVPPGFYTVCVGVAERANGPDGSRRFPFPLADKLCTLVGVG
jgi:hypothetical protein